MSTNPKTSTNPAEPEETNRGLVLVFTGNGKGKTTAALGTVLRAVGYRHRCLIVQFVKGSWSTGELKSVQRLEPEVEFYRMGKGFVGILDDHLPREDHVQAAQDALAFCRERLSTGNYQLVVLDEVFVALSLNLITISQVLELLETRPALTSLILTGRDAPEEIINRADTVTEMREVKHAYQKGILALRGVDY